ncbi:MAG: P-loop NTPase fold protein [Roseibium sp.]
MREKGSELVNATLRKLTDLAAKGGDDAVWARLEELQQEYSKTGKPEKTLKTEGGSFEIEGGSAEFETFEPELPADEDNEAENVDVKAAEERLSTAKNVWLLQYNEGDRVSNWTREAVPGSTIRWKTGKALPRAMQAGDSVVYWRTTAKGGVVGTGHVLSTDVEDENGINRFPTEVREFNEDNLIPRKEAIEAAKIDRKNWRGAVLDLPADQAERLNHHLKEKGWLGFGPEANPNPGDTQEAKASADDAAAQRVQGEINMRRDDAERDHDALGRAPLAISLAWALHEIWCNEQGLNQRSGHEPQEEAPGFVAHVDAPWGGGKTSFANLIARTLNPNLDDKIPEFLKKRYPDRKDMSGLFLAAAHEKGGLVENDRAKYVRAARRPWIIVPYNAWLNQHVDPPWWSFYQTIRKTCFQSIRKEGCPEVVQKGDGSYENHKESWLNRFDRWRGLWVRELWWRLSTPKVVIQLSVTFVSVLIGYLLYQLGLVAEVKGKAAIVTTSGIGLVLALITGAGSFIGAAITVLADALAPGRNALGEKVALGSADPLKRFRTHFAKMMKAVERPVLVIIDDIDRCEPKFIVEMTRGLQTILKSPRVVYLLLGDRNWIEQAFEVCHEDMKSIDVGAEHTFGGRFVEKAIQLSFILPGITGKKEDYVREVLSGRSSGSSAARSVQTAQPELARLDIQKASLDSLLLDDADQAGVEKGSAAGSAEMSGRNTNMDENEEISDAALLRVRNEMSQAKTAKEISAVGAAQSKAFGGDRALKRAVREETVLRRSAQREEVEEAIRHWLQPLAKYLPGNPRHIKRIINAVFMYQNSLLLTEEDYDEADFGGDQWRQLVIGVVLMVGYPNSWSLLTHHPDWVEPLSAGLESLPSEGTTANSSAFAEYQSLSRNKNFVELLSKTELRDTSGEVQQTLITEDTVRWLNELIPLNGR